MMNIPVIIEETTKTAQGVTTTIKRIITEFTFVFSISLAFLSFQKGWLTPLIFSGLISLVIVIVTITKLLRKHSATTSTTTQED